MTINATKTIQDLITCGNIPQAETFCRIALEENPEVSDYYFLLGIIAATIGAHDCAINYFNDSIRLAPEWELPKLWIKRIHNIDPNRTWHHRDMHHSGYILIKAWGYGFWSDVDHVLGQLLLAEITSRTPIVFWGTNSLFGDGKEKSAFEYYFREISDTSVNDLIQSDYDYFPPKWNHNNLMRENINKFQGNYSRMAGLYFLNRPEKVLVSDFYTRILSLIPWIPNNHLLYGKPVNEIYCYLIDKYLQPQMHISIKVKEFIHEHLFDDDYISVHMRGTDKIHELKDLNMVNNNYYELIDSIIAQQDYKYIFLMTDDTTLLDAAIKRYGKRIVTKNCIRSPKNIGVHHLKDMDNRRLGTEMMLDTYTAIKGKKFIGNGFSNPSAMIQHLTNWDKGNFHLIGPSIHHTYNTTLHNR